jgi:hypothetical protein
MKKSNDNVKKVPRFGVLDLVIILLVIVAVIGIYFRYNIAEAITNARDLKQYTISYSIDNIRSTTADSFINVGDDVYFISDNKKFGTLTSASENKGPLDISYPSELFTTVEGEIVEVFYPTNSSRRKAEGRLVCDGRYSTDGSFLVNGSTHIAMGQYIDVRTEYVTFTVRIDYIRLFEE